MYVPITSTYSCWYVHITSTYYFWYVPITSAYSCSLYSQLYLRQFLHSHCCRGPRNQWLLKLSIVVSPLHHFTFVLFAPHYFTRSSFHHVNMVVYSVHHFTIALYQSISSYHIFTFSPIFHNFTAKRRKKASSEQQAKELFGFCGSDEGNSEEDVGKKNREKE